MRKRNAFFVSALCVCLLSGCGNRSRSAENEPGVAGSDSIFRTPAGKADTFSVARPEPPKTAAPGPTARRLDSLGYVNVRTVDSSIRVRIVYATADNFTGKVLYDDLREAYLLPEVAEALVLAQRLLKTERPDLCLIVYDAARPMSVQWRMKAAVRGTDQDIYVSNPENGGGLHNYGAAVDLSLADADGIPLPMGTPFDFLGPEAHITREEKLVSAGKITEAERQNRLLLRRVMKSAGFRPLSTEWWHFNYYSRTEARARLKVIE